MDFIILFVVVRKMNPFLLFLHHASLLEKKASLILSYSSQLLGEPFLSKKILKNNNKNLFLLIGWSQFCRLDGFLFYFSFDASLIYRLLV
jgi:hypothetical protein